MALKYLTGSDAIVMCKYQQNPITMLPFTSQCRPTDQETVLVRYSDGSVRYVYFVYWFPELDEPNFDYRDIDLQTLRVVERNPETLPVAWCRVPNDLKILFR